MEILTEKSYDFRRNVPLIRKVRVLFKPRLIFPCINGPIVNSQGRNSDFFVMCAFGFVGLSTFQRTRFELHREVSKRSNTLFSSSSLSLEDS